MSLSCSRFDAGRPRAALSAAFSWSLASLPALAALATLAMLTVLAMLGCKAEARAAPLVEPMVEVVIPAGSAGAAGPASSAVPAGSGPAPGAGRPLRFAALGDTGRGNAGQRSVAKALERTCAQRGCDFVLLLGDNIYDSGPESEDDPAFEERFEAPYRGVAGPFFAAVGNHDCGGNGTGHQLDKARLEIAYSKRSSKWRMPGRYYRVGYPGVDLVAVDTNAQMYGDDEPQRRAVAQMLTGSKATWKIAFGHHPYLSNGKHGNAGSYDGVPSFVPIAPGQGVKSFLEEAVCGKADLYLSAHDHSRQWLEATCQGTELAVSGAGSSTTTLPGANVARFQSIALGFLYVTVDGASLRAEMIDDEGEVDFVRELAK